MTLVRKPAYRIDSRIRFVHLDDNIHWRFVIRDAISYAYPKNKYYSVATPAQLEQVLNELSAPIILILDLRLIDELGDQTGLTWLRQAIRRLPNPTSTLVVSGLMTDQSLRQSVEKVLAKECVFDKGLGWNQSQFLGQIEKLGNWLIEKVSKEQGPNVRAPDGEGESYLPAAVAEQSDPPILSIDVRFEGITELETPLSVQSDKIYHLTIRVITLPELENYPRFIGEELHILTHCKDSILDPNTAVLHIPQPKSSQEQRVTIEFSANPTRITRDLSVSVYLATFLLSVFEIKVIIQ